MTSSTHSHCPWHRPNCESAHGSRNQVIVAGCRDSRAVRDSARSAETRPRARAQLTIDAVVRALSPTPPSPLIPSPWPVPSSVPLAVATQLTIMSNTIFQPGPMQKAVQKHIELARDAVHNPSGGARGGAQSTTGQSSIRHSDRSPTSTPRQFDGALHLRVTRKGCRGDTSLAHALVASTFD